MKDAEHSDHAAPLRNLEEWDDFLRSRYPVAMQSGDAAAAGQPNKKKDEFRDYEADAKPGVREFYRLNHRYQTHEFALAKRRQYLTLDRKRMGVWEAAEYLNTLVDDSDPDTDLSQLQHLLQTSEHIRADGHPRWFILAGFIHDLGKILCLWGEPQWAVVGDTFPTGCRYSEKNVFPQFFADNPDSQDSRFQSPLGVYQAGCGLDQVTLSWGHDEYIYHVVKDYLPDEALAMLRYHSFYAWHHESEYGDLTNDHDRRMLEWVKTFNQYDLYTKSHAPPDVQQLRPYYEELIAEFFPATLNW
jgi:inositol oxygenase